MSRKSSSTSTQGSQRGVGRMVSLKVLLTIALGTQRGLGRASSVISGQEDLLYDLIVDCEYSSDILENLEYTSDILVDSGVS